MLKPSSNKGVVVRMDEGSVLTHSRGFTPIEKYKNHQKSSAPTNQNMSQPANN